METAVKIREVVVSTVVDELTKCIDGLDVRNFNRERAPTIHQIRIDVRKGNESAYTPKFVSIGPYHRDLHEQTKGMKILYLKDFLHRTGKDVKHYASLIESREEEARDCYHDRCNGLKSEEFVQMMVLDGCFIIEFFLKCNERNNGLSLIMPNACNWVDLRNDLMLMENQIPFFILKLILDSSPLCYEVQEGVTVDWRPEILDLCLFFLHGSKITKDMLEQTHQEGDLCLFSAYGFLFLIKCFLLLFFYALIYLLDFIKLANKIMWQKPNMHNRQKAKAKEKRKPIMIPTATELNEFGVAFKRKKDAKNSIDVSFENGIMEIPQVLIEDRSNSIFRNFLALEQNIF